MRELDARAASVGVDPRFTGSVAGLHVAPVR
jgi:hypothetical protein